MTDKSLVAFGAPIRRIGLVVGGLMVAAAAFVQASSEAAPGLLESNWPLRSSLNANELTELVDSRFRVEMSQATDSSGQLPQLSPSLVQLAREAYARDPLQASNLRTIAVNELGQGNEERARQLMRLAQRMSKRDEVVNLWLARDYGISRDADAMTASFDYALRTSARAREVAIRPVVVNALANEESHVPLGELLSKQPEWEGAFWREFVQNPVAFDNAETFFSNSGISVDRIPLEDRRTLYANLKALGRFDTLRRLAALDPEARSTIDALASGRFVTADEGNPLAWTLHSRGTFGTTVRGEPTVLEIDARGGSFGLAAERVVEAGRNIRLAISMAEPVPANATIKLSLICPGESSTTLGEISLGPGERSGEELVDARACPDAALALSFSVAEGRSAALMQVARVTALPV